MDGHQAEQSPLSAPKRQLREFHFSRRETPGRPVSASLSPMTLSLGRDAGARSGETVHTFALIDPALLVQTGLHTCRLRRTISTLRRGTPALAASRCALPQLSSDIEVSSSRSRRHPIGNSVTLRRGSFSLKERQPALESAGRRGSTRAQLAKSPASKEIGPSGGRINSGRAYVYACMYECAYPRGGPSLMQQNPLHHPSHNMTSTISAHNLLRVNNLLQD